MDPIKDITGWFKRLAWGRVNAAKAQAKGTAYGHQAKIKSKVAGEFNNRVDGAVKKSKAKVQGKSQAKSAQKNTSGAPPKQDKKMGLFGRKDKDNQGSQGGAPQQQEMIEPEEHTVALSVGEQTGEFRECVGWVVVRNGPMKGHDFRLVAGKNVLGTTADCDVVLTDPYLSSKHCVLRFEEGQMTLIDLDSTNGTFANNNRIVKVSLVDNDSIRVGRTELKFKALE